MTKVSRKKLDEVIAALREAGLEFIVTRTDDSIAHLNIWIGD